MPVIDTSSDRLIRRVDVMHLKLGPISSWTWQYIINELSCDEYLAKCIQYEEQSQADKEDQKISLPDYSELMTYLDKVKKMSAEELTKKLWNISTITNDIRQGCNLIAQSVLSHNLYLVRTSERILSVNRNLRFT